jgi:protein-S-isoprenylcysteine O-methyltransferase Ste14
MAKGYAHRARAVRETRRSRDPLLAPVRVRRGGCTLSRTLSASPRPEASERRSGPAKLARLLQLDRGRIRTLLLAAGVLFGHPTWTSLAIGFAVIVPGAALHLWTKGCLRIGAEVTTCGPYRWVRNPFYLATFIVDAGLCVVIAEPWVAAVYLPIWVVVHWLTIRFEERALTEIFGERYTAYRAKVPWLLPWRGRASGLPESKGFSWDNPQLVAGVEYARLVRTFASPLIVFVGCALRDLRGDFFTSGHAPELACAAALVALFVAERLLVLRSRRRKAGGGCSP